MKKEMSDKMLNEIIKKLAPNKRPLKEFIANLLKEEKENLELPPA